MKDQDLTASPLKQTIDPIRERLLRLHLAACGFDKRAYLFAGITSGEIQELCLALLPIQSEMAEGHRKDPNPPTPNNRGEA